MIAIPYLHKFIPYLLLYTISTAFFLCNILRALNSLALLTQLIYLVVGMPSSGTCDATASPPPHRHITRTDLAYFLRTFEQ